MGLFEQIEKGANKVTYTPHVTKESILDAMKNIQYNQQKQTNYDLVMGASMAVMAREQIEIDTMMAMKKQLMELYLSGEFTAQQYNKIEKLINSKDEQNLKLGLKLINSKL
jgi:hypothetical protein